ncbi:hypothetical protein ACLOJK_004175 [Asimina triloba]
MNLVDGQPHLPTRYTLPSPPTRCTPAVDLIGRDAIEFEAARRQLRSDGAAAVWMCGGIAWILPWPDMPISPSFGWVFGARSGFGVDATVEEGGCVCRPSPRTPICLTSRCCARRRLGEDHTGSHGCRPKEDGGAP